MPAAGGGLQMAGGLVREYPAPDRGMTQSCAQANAAFSSSLVSSVQAKVQVWSFSAGSFVGLALLRLLGPLPHVSCEGKLGAIACPPSLLFSISEDTANRVHLIHYTKDKLCVCA